MIYRILAKGLKNWGEFKWVLCGAFSAGLDGFDELKTPSFRNPRARFYFTERGWREFGRHIVAGARREGRIVRVVRRKNPLASQIVYQDEFQVAILSRKEKEKDKKMKPVE